MKEKEYWNSFFASGRIEDYLACKVPQQNKKKENTSVEAEMPRQNQEAEFEKCRIS